MSQLGLLGEAVRVCAREGCENEVVGHGSKRYCDVSCRKRDENRRRNPLLPRRPCEREGCGNEIEGRADKRFCSWRCSDRVRKGRDRLVAPVVCASRDCDEVFVPRRAGNRFHSDWCRDHEREERKREDRAALMASRVCEALNCENSLAGRHPSARFCCDRCQRDRRTGKDVRDLEKAGRVCRAADCSKSLANRSPLAVYCSGRCKQRYETGADERFLCPPRPCAWSTCDVLIPIDRRRAYCSAGCWKQGHHLDLISEPDEVFYARPRRLTKQGYVQVSCFREHRLIMERHLGRFLEPYEHVDHRDTVRHHNDLENLRLRNIRVQKHGAGQPVSELLSQIDDRDRIIDELRSQLVHVPPRRRLRAA